MSPAVHNFRRSELERWIDNAIALLDTLDGDADLEDNADAEPEESDQDGDEEDGCHSEDEWAPLDPVLQYDGSGVDIGQSLVNGLPTFWNRPMMKALIEQGCDPNRSEIEIMKRRRRQR